ncbi:hypothetical protein QTI33_34305 [Variovorax sp. J22P271]|uniref:hypothetical protein n=1 Tax=Variovorax davisae TaxID=3053515 RepID=UPI0025749B55|nr:hypothetical protein [Variovorax sp. J22P271]MDM0037242.1 hypothetical protein [Variovorax sp. J22P271]
MSERDSREEDAGALLQPRTSLVAEMLRRPTHERKYATALVAIPYSFKMQDRVYVYRDERYVLWAKFEFDRKVIKYNFEPPPLYLPNEQNTCVQAAAASSAEDGRVTLHFTPLIAAPKDVAVREWVERLELQIRQWRTNELDRNATGQISREKLLRYICVPGHGPNVALEQAIFKSFSIVQKRNLTELVHLFPQIDPTLLKTSLAHMLYMGNLHADIDAKPFSPSTEFSKSNIFLR